MRALAEERARALQARMEADAGRAGPTPPAAPSGPGGRGFAFG